LINSKIIFCISSLSTAGGAERIISILANETAAKGLDVTVLLIGDSKNIFYSLNKEVQFYELKLLRNNKGYLGKLLNNVRIIYRLRSHFKKIKPHVIVSFIDRTNISVLFASIGLSSSVVVSERNDPSQYSIGALWECTRRVIYRTAKVVWVQTEQVKQLLNTKWRLKNVVVLANPLSNIDTNFLSWNSRQNIILTVGRLMPQKDHALLIEAWGNIYKQHPGWKLHIVGDGPEKNRLHAIVDRLNLGDATKFTQLCNPIWPMYSQSKIFALTSKYEGFPNALLEAASMGCACISFDCNSGPKDILANGKLGILVRSRSANDFSSELNKLINSEKLQKAYSKSSVVINERYSLRRHIQKFLQIISIY